MSAKIKRDSKERDIYSVFKQVGCCCLTHKTNPCAKPDDSCHQAWHLFRAKHEHEWCVLYI